MSAEENRAMALRVFNDVLNARQPCVYRDLVSPDIVVHFPQYPEPIRGMEALIDWMERYQQSWDSHFTVNRVVAEGDDVAVSWTKHAIHTGDYLGIPATGREITITGTHWLHFVNGRCCEVRVNLDSLNMMQQVGVFPKALPPRALFRLIVGFQKLFRRPAVDGVSGTESGIKTQRKLDPADFAE